MEREEGRDGGMNIGETGGRMDGDEEKEREL